MKKEATIKELIKMAKGARENAHAPYSQFKVGAAILTSEGKVFTGCNIESLSSGLALCAERVALAKAISEGYRDFERLVLVADCQGMCSPCGSCRQALYEFNSKMLISMVNLNGKEKEIAVSKLLPSAFRLKDEKVNSDG
ncbi:MAG TPA: cytidine deaminase [Candidatus Subteraquimicrobiales bacterium]